MVNVKVALICSNYGSSKDGIGDYSKNIVDRLSLKNDVIIRVYSADIINYNIIRRIISLAMSRQIVKFIKDLKKEKYDLVDIEYPFTEWNPLIVLFFLKLAKACKCYNTKVVVSVHEYIRVNKLRKKVIEYLVKKSDKVLVTDDYTKNKLFYLNNNIYIRGIPSNIQPTSDIDCENKDNKMFLFFGLVNKSKAFDEMIDGWKMFHNKFNEYKLYIVSSSNLSIIDYDKYNIIYKKNLPSNKVAELMNLSTYCILPIKPNVNYNNATLKTACLFSCIPIGVFNNCLDNCNSFWIDMFNYSKDEFYNAFIKAINNENIKEMQTFAKEFGKMFDIEGIVDVIYNAFIDK